MFNKRFIRQAQPTRQISILCFIKTIDAEIEQPPTIYFHSTIEFFQYIGQNRRRRTVKKQTTRSIDEITKQNR